MKKRRQFLKIIAGFLSGIGISLSPLSPLLRWGSAKTTDTVLAKDITRDRLIRTHPASIDTRGFPVTPLEEFKTMGTTNHKADMQEWYFEVAGDVANPLKLSYEEIRALPSIERKVLLICPGFFANHGLWKGVSMKALLNKANVSQEATHALFTGPKGRYVKKAQFSIEDLLADNVFLAYEVNGKPLPIKHGFPLRVVAEGHYGFKWVKYAYSMTLSK